MIKVAFLGSIAKKVVEMKANTLADVSAKLKVASTLTQWLHKPVVPR